MKFIVKLLLFGAALSAVLLSGCYGAAGQNQAPPHEYILLVQGAVDQYHKKTGVLPIKNSAADTPIYEKYVIDFKRLKDGHFLSTIPTNAFENGGTNLYVLVNVETKPEVKLLDLVSYQQIGDLQKQVDDYRARNGGRLPLGERIAGPFHWIDFDLLRQKPPTIKSPYSRMLLNPVIHESGKVAIDYAPELMRLLEKAEKSIDPKSDLREILVAESYYVPVHSYPYRLQNNEPVISEN